MRIRLSTPVQKPLDQVVQGFNEDLFKRLSPPFPKVKVIQFDGCRKGHIVALRLDFLLFKQWWTSTITEDQEDSGQFYFIDEGTKIPAPLKHWRHKHLLEKNGEGTIITDDVYYTTGLWFLDILLYPLLAIQFIYRKPIYKNIFGKN
ncbi:MULTISPECIES: SRPBCC family protein [Roseivirga]|jgi:ligand-binding SRPBCC domain-containing protein|uniref:Ligand-binding SRPBCC domain-containing protein n=1 Tax=Roseivirga thermotolerans TaxID=1758176 RepID=A0ABQ3I4Y5_9BACT|nr:MULTISPECIES: hypothetical protein [Roseivirga]MEC7755322.1 hypothetical protein [Bacteroidota bacterium]GHE54714.1 hypothetical protein GCM10011340_06740 [Roseivirga thermotolerans]|tara:strand:- start:12083 stop:12523 length:441 start_codon:yes stop_codon:yes gene_type:complete